VRSARNGVRMGASLVGCLLAATLGIGPRADASYQFVTKWGSRGSGDGQFESPKGIAVDAVGNVYVADSRNHRIQEFDGSGTFLTKWGSQGSGDGQFALPLGVIVDAAGNVYVTEAWNNRLQKFDGGGTFLAKWGSQGKGDGQFNEPWDVAVDTAGNVYVADEGNHRIQKFDGDGTFLRKWGSLGRGNGQFDDPKGVAVDALGNVYVAESGNHRLEKFDSSGTFVTKWGSFGRGDGQFDYPCAVAVDGAGEVYVVDGDNDRIQKFDGNGAFLTKWGSRGGGDGKLLQAGGVAVDAVGNVYVADSGNHRIEKYADLPPVPPVLSWAGEAGYLSDGCDPDIGEAGTTRPTFKVRVTDRDWGEPTYVQLLLRRDGAPWRHYKLRRGTGPTYESRCIYHLQLPEPLPPGRYKYRFRAKDDAGFATGPATVWQFGPSTYPQLSFSGEPGLEDGVTPNTGTADTTFLRWRVIYQDNDGDAPSYVQVRLWRDGSYYGAVPMVAKDAAPDAIAGITYSARRRLPAGNYEYEFRAADKDGRARGPASQRMSGLSVTPGAPGALSGVAALPTNAGAQICFTLLSTAEVGARVINLAGRPVATLCHARNCEAGANTLVWSARSDNGLPAPNGTYLIEISARTPDGSQSRALARVRLER